MEQVETCIEHYISGRFRWRWRAVTAWIIIFTIVVMFILLGVTYTKADITDLQTTNCSLKSFLVRAANTRQKAANELPPEDQQRKIDQAAVDAYHELADLITAIGHCDLPETIRPSSPLQGG